MACYRHGMSKTPTYNSWSGMIQRCTNENSTSFEDYGKKGIIVCDRWLDDFRNFLQDMGERPEDTSLDRINGSGNYEPSNCRWADAHTQIINRTSTRWIEFNGEKLCIKDWARKLGISYVTLRNRINIQKWSIEKSLTVLPVMGRNQYA